MASVCKISVWTALVVLFSLTIMPYAEVIKCYECNSAAPYEEDCVGNEEKLKAMNATEVTCTGYCYKYEMNVDKDIEGRIARGCSEEKEYALERKDEDEGCVFSTGIKGVQMEICNCKDPKKICNSGSYSLPTYLVLASAALMAVMAQLIQG